MNNKEHIEQLIQKFLNGQTSETEEKTLSDFFCNGTIIPEEWNAYKELFESFKTDAYNFSEKEIQEISKPLPKRLFIHSRAFRWASAACVAVTIAMSAILLWKKPSSEQPAIAQAKQQTIADSSISITNELITLEIAENQKVTGNKKPTSSESATEEVNSKQHNHVTPKQEISTPELLEAINKIAEMYADNATITACPDNNEIEIKAVSADGISSTFVLNVRTDNNSNKQTTK